MKYIKIIAILTLFAGCSNNIRKVASRYDLKKAVNILESKNDNIYILKNKKYIAINLRKNTENCDDSSILYQTISFGKYKVQSNIMIFRNAISLNEIKLRKVKFEAWESNYIYLHISHLGGYGVTFPKYELILNNDTFSLDKYGNRMLNHRSLHDSVSGNRFSLPRSFDSSFLKMNNEIKFYFPEYHITTKPIKFTNFRGRITANIDFPAAELSSSYSDCHCGHINLTDSIGIYDFRKALYSFQNKSDSMTMRKSTIKEFEYYEGKMNTTLQWFNYFVRRYRPSIW